MNNKQELQKQAEKLQKELDILKDKINSPKSIFDISTYREVCDELRESMNKSPYEKIKQIEKYFNQGWKPNWKDLSEYKYYPWFSFGSGGLVFSGSSSYYSFFGSECAFYKTKEISNFVGENFIKEYQDLMNS